MANDAELKALAGQISEVMLSEKMTVTTAESCTGGWVAKALTDIPGSSAWFSSGFVAYSDDAKARELGVREEIIAKHGAVSDAVVREMAAGAIAISEADTAVAVSGIAGPDGGTSEKPVGTVWFAWARVRADGSVTGSSAQHRFDGDREAVRRQAVETALKGILELV
ncbi:MAG: nicotinamide-nucleotide amidase [Gammaproteobacteria bacterium]